MDYVKIDVPAKEFKAKMVDAGNAVESMTEQGTDVQKVVVGNVERIVKHPDADKLFVCDVNVGTETVQIVTGADNVFAGALVPVALDGSILPNGMKIKKGKLRGVESLGMLCSGEELKLSEADYAGAEFHGILILKEEYAPGTDIRKVFGWDDTIFEFEVGANRPDCLSVLGLSREAAAVFGTNLTLPDTSFKEAGGNIADYVAVEVKDAKLCPRYIARAIKNVKIGPSPKWMQERLKAAGVRPISNIVDITNFVMLASLLGKDGARISPDRRLLTRLPVGPIRHRAAPYTKVERI
jgi:phenylalanyl-tRNA synthetase beta chain